MINELRVADERMFVLSWDEKDNVTPIDRYRDVFLREDPEIVYGRIRDRIYNEDHEDVFNEKVYNVEWLEVVGLVLGCLITVVVLTGLLNSIFFI